MCRIIVLLILTISTTSLNDRDSITWNSKLILQFEYFKKTPPENTGKIRAITYVEIKYYQIALHVDSILLHVTTAFIKDSSWIKDYDSCLLNHEKGHFDIAEITARKIRKTFSEYTSFDLKETKKYLSEKFRFFLHVDMDKMNNQYDLETSLGTNLVAQRKWDKKIKSMLKQYEKYENTKVIIKRKTK